MAEEDPKTEVLERAKSEKVQFVQMQFMDILGTVKTVAIPMAQLEKAMDDGILFDGSSIVGYATIEESDLRARPDISTFETYPWTSGDLKTAGMVCSIYDHRGERFSGDPRYVLERQMERARKMGYAYYTGPEYEFFLFKFDETGKPTNMPSDAGHYFDQLPLNTGEVVRKKATLYFDAMNFEVEASHHEVAPGQHEIDLKYADALTSADRVLVIKHGLKTVALEHGLHATFMPKPWYGQNGSGMHVHQSLTTLEGKNVFFEPTGEYELSDICRWFIGGVLHYARETCAILASWVNSYKRLVPGFEAPVYISWANLNRSALIRVPSGRGTKTRIEVRNPDPAGNPYLQYGAMLAAGLYGVEERIEPQGPVETDIYRLTSSERQKLGILSLPGSLEEALNELEASELMRETLGAHIWTHLLYVKRQEWDEYRTQVTDWELERFLELL
ncbi:MAG: type I glutamate--ammonia ligase [Thermoplasmata archaeon]